jgi:hypothetical protein
MFRNRPKADEFKQATLKSHRILLNGLLDKLFSLFSTSQKQAALTMKFLRDLNYQLFSSLEYRVYGDYRPTQRLIEQRYLSTEANDGIVSKSTWLTIASADKSYGALVLFA